GTYRGESRFTTWAYTFVMNLTSAKLARQATRPLPLTMEDRDWDRLPDRLSVDPQHSAEVRRILGALPSAVEQQLTESHGRVFVAVALNEVAIDELAEQLGANRNAIYKTLFVARRKLLVHLEATGYRITATAPNLAQAGAQRATVAESQEPCHDASADQAPGVLVDRLRGRRRRIVEA